MMAPLHNAGLALVLKGEPALDAAEVTRIVVEVGLPLRAEKTRGDRQFGERRFSDDDGLELVYREDHVLGLRVLLFAGPDVFELRDHLAERFAHHTPDDALAAAEAADAAGIVEKVATLGPLVALVAYGEAESVERAAYALLHRRIRDKELAVRRAALCCASYLVAPEVTEILNDAVSDAELAVEVKRQLALRTQLDGMLDHHLHLERADVERLAGRPLAALVAVHIALALARRLGVRLHDMMAQREILLEALAATTILDDGALGSIAALLDLGRFHEAEEVATELLSLHEEGTARLTLLQRVSLVSTLLGALRGRGRHDRAAALLAEELTRLEATGDGESVSAARRHLESLL